MGIIAANKAITSDSSRPVRNADAVVSLALENFAETDFSADGGTYTLDLSEPDIRGLKVIVPILGSQEALPAVRATIIVYEGTTRITMAKNGSAIAVAAETLVKKSEYKTRFAGGGGDLEFAAIPSYPVSGSDDAAAVIQRWNETSSDGSSVFLDSKRRFVRVVLESSSGLAPYGTGICNATIEAYLSGE